MILPENYYKAEHVGGAGNDREWILEQLQELPIAQQRKASEAYSSAYKGSNRAECNERLRAYVKKYTSMRAGNTVTPPGV